MFEEYTIDLAPWIERFPISEAQPTIEDGWGMSGPFDLALTAQWWAQVDTDKTPIDAFLWQEGEPELRHVTKVGGLPYRPADLPWPTGEEGPMKFVGQICLAGSKDILTHDLPGDVLLFFTPDTGFGYDTHCEWYDLGLSNLIPPDQVPKGGRYPSVTCFGHRCRMAEPDLTEEYDLQIGITKIGGAPGFVQDSALIDDPFLCKLSSFRPNKGCPYPWIGKPDPTPDGPFAFSNSDEEMFCMADMGELYAFIDDDEIWASFSCY